MIKYLDVWQRIFTSPDRKSYENVLHLIELLLITPSTNAKLERMFGRMNRVKNDWCNRLTCERLENNLHIGKYGPSIKDFDPKQSIMHWSNEKMRNENGYEVGGSIDLKLKLDKASAMHK